MTKKELEIAVDNAWCLVDDREKITDSFKERVVDLYNLFGGEDKNRPERLKLDYGDYSFKTVLADGSVLDGSKIAIVERKVGFQELIGNLLTNRERFEKEFTRAKDSGAKIHLLVENASYTKLYNGTFPNHPFANVNSVKASFFALMCRYDITVHFCKPEHTAQIIHDVLIQELVNYLQPKDAHRYEVEHEHRRTKKNSDN